MPKTSRKFYSTVKIYTRPDSGNNFGKKHWNLPNDNIMSGLSSTTLCVQCF